jgi:hypothetical protein
MKPPRQSVIHWLFVAVYLSIYKFAIEPHVTAFGRSIVLGLGLAAFLGWLARDTLRTKRDLKAHRAQLDERKRANRQAKEEARVAARPATSRTERDG